MARAMATGMRVMGGKEGDGGKAMPNKDDGKWTATATKMEMVTKTRVVGKQRQQ
jgi:hypothetical protein